MRAGHLRWIGIGVVAAAAMSALGGLLENAGFEVNAGPGGVARAWESEGEAGAENWPGAHSAEWQMAIKGWGTNYGAFAQDYPASEGACHTFSIWANGDGNFGAASVDLKLEWYDAARVQLGAVTNNIFPNLVSAWRRFAVSGVAPAGTKTVRVVVRSDGIRSGGAVRFDDADIDVTETGLTRASTLAMEH